MTAVHRSISLEEWEAKTQLSESELQSVYELQDACAELPLPSNWSSSSPALPRSSGGHTPDSLPGSGTTQLTPLNAGALSNRLLTLSTRPRSSTNLLIETTTADSEAQTRSAQELGAEKPVETLQQFFDWFAQMESEMERDQEDIYRNYLGVVSQYRQSCDDFLKDLEDTSKLFDDLGNEYGFVEMRTRSLQSACEKLLNEQERLTRLADALAERLTYFNQLEPIAKLFNSPGEDVCLHPEFVPMLQKLDECIQYMQQHLKYRDAELYLMRFQQCLTRGMTVIKMYLVSSIKSLGYDVYKQISSKTTDQPLALSKQTTLLYVKFRMLSSTLKPLSIELSKRCEGHKEYQALYQDILSSYFQTRQNLLGPVISRKIQDLGPYNGDLLEFARNGCAYMMSLCLDEFNLFFNMFPSGDDDLYTYLDLLTSYLYDYLRKRIIHENDISVLSELCNIFQMYVATDRELTNDDNDEQQHSLEFGHLIANVLEDAQAKLVFRAQTYIHNEIQNYQPKAEDFELHKAADTTDIPKSSIVLEGSKSISTTTETTEEAPATLAIEEDTTDTQSTNPPPSNNDNSSGSPLGQGTDTSRGWFPTLQKTLWILSKLYQCVQTVVFEDLAQEAVSLCNESLKQAFETITTKKSRLDGQLFMIRHLLVLKEQLAPFEANLVHSGKELDFSHVTDTLNSLQQNRSLIFNPNTLIGLAQRGMPRVVEISLDSRREIDRELKRICENFISDCVHGAVEPLTNFTIKVTTMAPGKTIEKDEILDTVGQFKESAGERIRFVVRKLREYVNDYKIEQILMKPIQMNALEEYKGFYRAVESRMGSEDIHETPIMSVEAAAVWLSQVKDQIDVNDDHE
ncbi:hypothetical protein O0I10_008684 [Lichtheimia ornata]|uniref:Conserved oligomeric Golgi complex subunit 3 n=1 Tax=Lichtheimia ornata TaxID=688661 RepID=A0AAD7XWP3_9FUNG|nr:uncharacterized protein O0I10_008684 [Lichtheimia ornata]KAJ8655596.1 hypothetical protein O0I10_008684 [Lichtheimia ornata]